MHFILFLIVWRKKSQQPQINEEYKKSLILFMKYTLFPFILCTPLKYANIAIIFSVVKNNISPPKIKICIIEVYLLNYYFESHLIYKWHYYRQSIKFYDTFRRSNSHNFKKNLCDAALMRERWHNFYFMRTLIKGLSQ